MSTDKEQKVVSAAWPVFLKYGYKRVTMADIANAAGISRPALYLVFNKKEEVFRAVIRLIGHQRLEEIREGVAQLKSPRERLRFAVETWAVRSFASIMGSEEAKELQDCNFEFARGVIEEGYEGFEAVLLPILGPLVKSSTLKGLSAKQIAHVLTCSLRGFKLVCEDTDQLGAMVDNMLTLVFGALTACDGEDGGGSELTATITPATRPS